MDFEKFKRIMRKYNPWGIKTGSSDLILPPDKALDLLDELAELGVVIIGGHVWYYVDRAKGWAREDIEEYWSLTEQDLASPDVVQRGAALARDYIVNRLPQGADAVSLTSLISDEESKATFRD